MHKRSRAFLAAILVVAACSDDGATSDSTDTVAATTTVAANTSASGYSAQITRTEYGIAHIVADDWG
ncbi:MAG: hypothetical protein HY826_11510, partial [Actinobacteria bacterium]|nr:hypothetical protein [Actinomycetota bacterium]